MNRILFVCSANKERSKTADDYFSAAFPELKFDSGGTNIKLCQKEGTTPLTEDMVQWADLIIAMEIKHERIITRHISKGKRPRLIVLNIPDQFNYYQKELIELLKTKVRPILKKHA